MARKKKIKQYVAIEIHPLNEKYCGECKWLDYNTGYCNLYEELLNAEPLQKSCEYCGHVEDLDMCCRLFSCIKDEIEFT